MSDLKFNIGIIGLGFVGLAIYASLLQKNMIIVRYDKYHEYDNYEDLFKTDILFLALPTIYDNILQKYNLEPIEENLNKLRDYKGPILIKSTVTPGICEYLAHKYSLNIIHNPEFLTAITANYDFHNQTHIVLGKTSFCQDIIFDYVINCYSSLYPNASISSSLSQESECMKLFCNSFYAVKIQFFNELYALCNKLNISYDTVKSLMLKNNWINPMHTQVPGPDKLPSYGGLCFPKDTNALLSFMIENNTPSHVLLATVTERNTMRTDHDNVKN